MSDTTTPATFPTAEQLDSVDHTDGQTPDAGVAGSVSAPPAPAPAPTDDRSEAEQALAPQPVDDPGPPTTATADDAVAPMPQAPPADVPGSAGTAPQTAAQAPSAGLAPIGAPSGGELAGLDHDQLMRELISAVLRLEEKVDGVAGDVGEAKAAIQSAAKEMPGMFGKLGHLFGGSGT